MWYHANMIKKTLLTNKTCGPCMVIKNKLRDLKIEVETKDFSVKEDQEIFYKHNVKSVPRLLVEDDENGVSIIQGYDDIIAALKEKDV
jgi:glutaredoxin